MGFGTCHINWQLMPDRVLTYNASVAPLVSGDVHLHHFKHIKDEPYLRVQETNDPIYVYGPKKYDFVHNACTSSP